MKGYMIPANPAKVFVYELFIDSQRFKFAVSAPRGMPTKPWTAWLQDDGAISEDGITYKGRLVYF